MDIKILVIMFLCFIICNINHVFDPFVGSVFGTYIDIYCNDNDASDYYW